MHARIIYGNRYVYISLRKDLFMLSKFLLVDFLNRGEAKIPIQYYSS